MSNVCRWSMVFASAISLLMPSRTEAAPLTLPAALAEARTASADLAVAKARVKVASAAFASADKLIATNPTLSGSYATGAPFGSSDRAWSLGLSQTIEIGGQQALRHDLVESEVAGSEADGGRVRNELLADVVVSFYGLDTARRALVVENEIVTLYNQLLVVAKTNLDKGVGTKLDVLTLEMEIARLRGDAATAKGLGDSLEAELRGLLGRTGAIEIEPTTDEVPKIDIVDVEALVAKALVHRPELAAARARKKTFQVEGTLAKREAWLSPTLGIGVQSERMVFGLEGFVTTGAGVPGLVGIDERRTTLVLTLSIPFPLFDARASTVAKASAGYDLASAEERSARTKIEAEVRAAAAVAKSTGDAFAIQEKARAATIEAAAAYRESFEKRQIGLGEALLGEERVLRARLAYLAARGSYLRARALLDKVSGAWAS